MTEPGGWPQRTAHRLAGHDYREPGAYFVTICTADRALLFGHVEEPTIHLNRAGAIVADCWRWLGTLHTSISLDAYVVMPNHVHGVIVINPVEISDRHGAESLAAGSCAAAPGQPIEQELVAPRRSLGRLVGAFKTRSTRLIHATGIMPGEQIWQRSFYDHIIRNGSDLDRVREYIGGNPARWAEDQDNPNGRRRVPSRTAAPKRTGTYGGE